MRVNSTFTEVGKRILAMLRWLSLIGYIGLIAVCLYNTIRLKGDWYYPQINMDLLLRAGIICVLIPGIVLILMFLKAKQKWHYIAQSVLQFGFIWFLPALILVFLVVLPMILWGSGTTKLENYNVFDKDVEEHMESMGFDILPEELPENIENASYSYSYSVPLDSVLIIDASWQYADADDYEREKDRIAQKKIVETYEENGYTVCKMSITASNSSAEFGYNDETRTVFYRIDGMW